MRKTRMQALLQVRDVCQAAKLSGEGAMEVVGTEVNTGEGDTVAQLGGELPGELVRQQAPKTRPKRKEDLKPR